MLEGSNLPLQVLREGPLLGHSLPVVGSAVRVGLRVSVAAGGPGSWVEFVELLGARKE